VFQSPRFATLVFVACVCVCGRRKQVIAPLQQTTTTTNQLIAINTLSSCYLKEPIENVGQFGGTNRQDGL
jgi:hypothetical protein